MDEFFERCDPCGGGDGISAERACLIDFSGGQDLIHDFAFTAVSGERHASAGDFAECGHVGFEAKSLLCTAEGNAEARHDFVANQNGAMMLG